MSGHTHPWKNEGIELVSRLIETVHNGIVIVDKNGIVLVYNQAARRAAQKPYHELIGKHFSEIAPESWPDMERLLATGEAQLGVKVKMPDSHIITNRSPIVVDGQIMGGISIFQDVSEYEQALKELEAYKELNLELDVIINSSYDGLWISDAKGRVVRLNKASERFAGVVAGEVIGKDMKDLVAQGYFDRSATLEVIKHKTAVSLIQQQKDGRQILVTGNPIFDENGDIRLVVVNARDLTALNQLKQELEESRELTRSYRSELTQIHRHQDLQSRLIMRSKPMRRVFEAAMRVARVDSSTLITGESGVGKGLMAKTIHEASPRREGPMVRVDCAGIPPSLIEAELFGYEKGAFTGARDQGKAGFFELAQDGTLFLDEIGELPLSVQSKLLRFLEDNQVTRVGSTTARQIDVRIISATNRDLPRMIRSRKFRKDLYFRLNVVPLSIPPLRERPEDIPPLIHHYLQVFNEKCEAHKSMSPDVVDLLCRRPFPGNVRELSNLIEQLVVMTPGNRIDIHDLPASVRLPDPGRAPLPETEGWNLNQALAKVEREMIELSLQVHGSQRRAAKALGINHSTLSRKVKKLGLAGA